MCPQTKDNRFTMKKRGLVGSIVLIAATSLLFGQANTAGREQPSFDCRKAASPSEKTITFAFSYRRVRPNP
jgi:hypothetical protein